MYQVSVDYVKAYGEKLEKAIGGTDGQTESKPIVLSGETGGGLITTRYSFKHTPHITAKDLYWMKLLPLGD